MDLTRRQLHALWPLLIAECAASTAADGAGAALPSRCYSFENLPVRVDHTNHAEYRQVFTGVTNDGCPIDLHITTMPPGQRPHPPHHHVHEEMMLVQKGQLEATIAGKSSTVGPGSVIYIASNEEHGLRNPGNEPAQYFVLAIGQQTKA